MPLSTTNLAPSSGTLFGSWCRERFPEDFSGGVPVSSEQIHYNFESRIGRQMGLVGSYMHFDDWKTSFPGSYQQRWANGGRLLFFRWKPDQAPGVAKWQDIADGVYDSYLTTAFTNMMNWQGGTGAGAVDTNKFFLAFHHEFDGDDYLTYGNAGDSATQGMARYKAAFTHIRAVRNSVGATNALLCWVVTGGSTFNQAKWLPAYPGDSLVDWVGFEPYNLYCITGSNWRWPTENWSAFLSWAQTNAPTPPIIMGEFGVGEHADDAGNLLVPSKAEWFRDGTQGVIPSLKKTPYNRIKAISYFHSSLNATDIRCMGWINSTTDAMSGFITMANDPQLQPDMTVGTVGGGGTVGSIVPRAFSTNNNASSATPTVTVPATTKGGDIIGVFFSTNSTGATINSFTSGYQLFSEVDDGTSQRTNLAWKIAAGALGTASSDASTTVGPTLSTTGIKTELFCFVYSGNSQTTPLTASGVAETATQATHTTPNVSTSDNGVWVLSIWTDRGTVVSGVSTNTTVWSLPPGETVRSEIYMTGSASPTLIASDTNQPHGPGTYGGKIASSDFANNNAVQWTIIVKPAASSTSGGGTGGGSGTTPVIIQHTGTGASATTASATGFTTAANVTLVALVARSGGLATGTISSINDTAGNVWSMATRGAVSGINNTRIELWLAPNAKSVTQINFASSASQTWAWNVLEVTNLPTAGVLATTSPDGSGVASSTSIPTPSVSTSNALVIAAFHSATTTPTAPGGAWTNLSNFDDGTNPARAVYQVVSAVGNYGATWTVSPAVNAGVVTVALNLSGAAGGATIGRPGPIPVR